MRNILWKITAFISVLIMLEPSAFTQGLDGWLDITKGNRENRQDGVVISDNDTFNRIMSLGFRKPVTSMISYQLNFRSNWLDTNSTDSTGDETTSYKRTVEPSLDLFLQNPMYDIGVGYRRREEWSTGHLSDDGRESNIFYYSRFGVTPEALPSLSIQFDRQNKFDYLTVSATDSTNTIYTINSAYNLPSSDVKFRYAMNFSRSTNETPLELTNKSERDNFNSTFNTGYNGEFWNNKAAYSIGYQGNYTRSKNEQFVSQTGIVLNRRVPLGGLYGQGDSIDNDVKAVLLTQGNLVDRDLETSTGINLSNLGEDFHNLGIFVSSGRVVDRFYVYVNQDILSDTNLVNTSGWRVFKSSTNQSGAWSEIANIQSVTASTVDLPNSIYRYEIKLLTPQSASFFKVINTVLSLEPNVEVTELEAYGEDNVDGTLVDVFSNYNQQMHFSVDVRPWDKWTFLLSYSIDRADENPESPLNSMAGLIGNIYSDKISEDHFGFSSNVSRNYGITSTWLTHSLLTTTFRIQRSESFDDTDETDSSSNTYNVSFFSAPIPAVDANLTLIKNDSFSFGEKTTTNNSAVLSLGTELYRNVNMITDVGYTKAISSVSGTKSSSRRINGTIDALLTKKLSSTANYSFSWNDTDGATSRSSDINATISYRPGRFINITSTFSFADSNDIVTTTEGILVDWLPLPAIRMNVTYQHSNTDPGPSKSDTINSNFTWYITKFTDLRTTYGYTKTVAAQETENINLRTSINCRF